MARPNYTKVSGNTYSAAEWRQIASKANSPGIITTTTVSIKADDEYSVKLNTMAGDRSYVKDASVVNDEGIGNGYKERFTYTSGTLSFSADFEMKEDALVAGHIYTLFAIWDGEIFSGGVVDMADAITPITPLWQTASFEVGNIADNIVVLPVDVALDTGSVPAVGDFNIQVDASPNVVTNVSLATALQVRLTLTSNVLIGETVTAAYTAGVNPIRSNATQTDAADFTATAVTNNVADANLLAYWDASIDSSVTTPNSNVSEWRDQTVNGNDLVEGTDFPSHSTANDTISFAGVSGASVDTLELSTTDFNFQQTDDFTVFVDGLLFDSTGGAAGQHVFNSKSASSGGIDDGASLNLSADGLTLFMSQRDASTQNFASYVLGATYKDDIERNFIFINESSVLKIYDATNTNVGTNGSASLGTITYDGLVKLGTQTGNTNVFNGSVKKIKVWDKALSAGERDTELGL